MKHIKTVNKPTSKTGKSAQPFSFARGAFSVCLSCIRCANGRTLICLNTCGLLKRAALERKESAGGRTCTFPVCSIRVCFSVLHFQEWL